MKQINREAIQRMVNVPATTNQGGDGEGGGSMAGYATQVWVEGNFLSKEFFDRIFTIHGTDANDNPVTVEPNDMDTTIVSVESMFGFWTDFYLSALGQGSGGSTAITLSMLDDVQLTSPSNGDVLTYNSTLGKWVNAAGGSSIDINAVWTALAAGTNEQINASHLSTALADYVTIATAQTITGTKTFSSIKLTDSIPEDTDMPFFLGINLFKLGGIVRWTSASNAKVGYASEAGAVAWAHITGMPNLVTTDTTQTITGTKTFSDIRLNNNIPEDTSMSFFLGINAFNQGGIVRWTKAADATVGNATTAATATKLKTAHSIWGQSFDGSANVTGNMSSVGNISFSASGKNIGSVAYFDTTNKRLGVGNSSPSYKLDVSGVIHCTTGLTSDGYVTALSDIRHKDIQGEVGLTVAEIANAPAVKFLWKDKRQDGLQVGSVAQYWKKALPEAVVEGKNGELTMSYGVIALLASIVNAREIVNLKREIAELKRRLESHGILK